ncbi:MAG: YibE/F family protein [Lachnospiraceae bacterium]
MILLLAVIFFALILLVGGDRGVTSLIALCGNIMVLLVAVTAMASDVNPIGVTIFGSVLINCITILYQNGKNKKSIAALLSVGFVMVFLLAVVFVISSLMHINGLNEIELQSELSLYYSYKIHVNMNLVCISMIVLGLTGAVMDTAVAISSAIYEVYTHNAELDHKELIQSGMFMGRDILSSTLNTLYFAYIGEALMLLLYLQKYKYSVMAVLNSKAFLQEFTCIIFSAIGCLIVIPVSAYVSAWIYKKW